MGATLRELTAAEFLDLLATPFAAEELSAAHGVAGVVVDLAGVLVGGPAGTDPATLATLALGSLPCVAVGLLPPSPPPAALRLGGRLDVVVSTPETLSAIRRTIEANPQASAALAVLLRGSEERPVEQGLAAESAVYSVLQSGPEFAAWLISQARVEKRHPGLPNERAEEPPVLVSRDGGVLRLTLNRPGVHNAFSAAMRDELLAGLALAAADPGVGRVILDGAGPSFCAGGDLSEFGSRPDPATAHLVRLTRNAGRLLARLADRLEVHVHGACIGAGIEMAAFAGRVVAHPDAFFELPEVGLGLIPGAGGTVSLPMRIGRLRTAELALSGRRVDAATARRWRLVDEVAGE